MTRLYIGLESFTRYSPGYPKYKFIQTVKMNRNANRNALPIQKDVRKYNPETLDS
jgi:hypothetical protein